MDRRQFLTKTSLGLGALALGSIFGTEKAFSSPITPGPMSGLEGLPHFAPKAKRIVYLFQSGGPSQFETFDYKPRLNEMFGTELPESVRGGQRLTGLSASQTSLPIAPSIDKFNQ